jgi:glucans biosynthesis protein
MTVKNCVFLIGLCFGAAFGMASPAWAAEEANPAPQAAAAPAAEGAAAPAAEKTFAPGFNFADVEKLAKTQASAGYREPDSRRAEALRAVREDRWNAIKFKDEHRLWRDLALPFEVSFFPPRLHL